MYAHGDPVNGVDPSGREFSVGGAFASASISAAIGGLTNGAISAAQGAALDQVGYAALRGASIGFVSGLGGYAFQALGYSSALGGLIVGAGESAAEAYFSGDEHVLRAALFGGLGGGLLGHLGPAVFNRLFGRILKQTGEDLFAVLAGKNLAQLSNRQVGDIGESIAETVLGENGYTAIIAIKNASNNGIDIVAKAFDGRLSFFEVKTSRIGIVKELSVRQQDFTGFIEDVLTQAAGGRGKYRSISSELQERAGEFLQEFREDPWSVSSNIIGVDLLNKTINVSPWPR